MNRVMKGAVKGFTLIELMIVVAIIGILAAIAIPKFADLLTKSRESAVKGSLGSIRGAVTIYYSDTEGVWPDSNANFTASLTAGGKYLQAIPIARIPPTSGGAPGHTGTTTIDAAGVTPDDGNWQYDQPTGGVLVQCTHNDTKGSVWNTW